jgi:hypothetical protein
LSVFLLPALQGSCSVNDTIELPALKINKQVKSMQMFKRPITLVTRGDRAALCVTQLNSKLLERGLAAAPGSVPTFAAAVAAVDKVRFYGGPVPGKAKYHMSIGHATVMAEAMFFGLPDAPGSSQTGERSLFFMVLLLSGACLLLVLAAVKRLTVDQCQDFSTYIALMDSSRNRAVAADCSGYSQPVGETLPVCASYGHHFEHCCHITQMRCS